jgi:hypothetical protein
MSIQRVDRIAVDGTTVTITLGRHQIAALKASYGDKIERATITEMGSQQIDAETPGNYSTEPLTISFEYITFHAEVMPLLQKDGFGNEKIPIVVGVSHPDAGDDSDLLDQCRFLEQKDSVENTNAARIVETTWSTNQVYWGEERKTRNQLDLSQPLAASNF